MTGIEQARRSVASAYVKRYADPATLERIEQLELENAVLRRSVEQLKRDGKPRTARYLVGSMTAYSILLAGIVLVLYWYRFTDQGADARRGFLDGWEAASPVRVIAMEPRQ